MKRTIYLIASILSLITAAACALSGGHWGFITLFGVAAVLLFAVFLFAGKRER